MNLTKRMLPIAGLLMGVFCILLTACTLPEKMYILLGVPYLSQQGWPTGCEAASAAMVLRYYGIPAAIHDVVNVMPKEPLTYQNGQYYGPDPNEAFVGSPIDEKSFGCYAGTAAEALNALLPDNMEALVLRGQNMTVLEQCIDQGQPVLVWASINMEPTYQTTTWTIHGTYRTFTWIAPEHCLVLVGYDEAYYYFQDPYQGNGLQKWDKSLVIDRYNAMGQQAVVVYENA